MPDLWDRFTKPRAGWLSLGLLSVMALALAWSAQGAGWLDRMDFLVPVALWATLAGALIGLSGVTIVVGLPLSALLGAGIVLWAIGGEYHTELDQLGRAFALRADAVEWTIAVLRTGYPAEMSPYAIGLGALMWATAFMAAHAVYRHHRILDAILLLGAALIVNMSATFIDLFGHLLLFVAAALLLWLRSSLVERRDGWQRRRVSEEVEVPGAIMRTGILFAAGSVMLAWLLTGVAIAAPLTGAWRNLDGVWTDVRDQFEGVFGSLENPQSRITGNSFGNSFVVEGEWSSSDEEAVVLAASRPLYLRAVAYDIYTSRGWERSDGPTREVPAGEALFTVPTPERPTVASAMLVEDVAVEMRQSIGRSMLTAASPLRVNAPSRVHESGGLPVIGAVEARNALGDGDVYEMTVAISRATEAELASAGTQYPDAVAELYLDDSLVTDRVRQRAEEVTEGMEAPYEKARALARYLRGSDFTYDTIGPPVPANGDLVDTFLFAENGRVGYCQHFASAMALMARSVGLPARVAVGFAPGEEIDDDLYLAREANAHAWAEIYFPGYGWEIFEATKSVDAVVRPRGDSTDLVGPADPGIDPLLMIDDWRNVGVNPIDALPSPDLIEGAVDLDAEEPTPVVDEEAAAARTGNALLIGVIVLGALVAAWLRLRHLDARWRLLPAGDRAWRRLTAAADRAGVGPRPSETIYEYAGWLEEQLPAHVEPIQVVANGKVWQSYSGRRLSAPAAMRLEGAWNALRLPLFGLAVRRGLRRLLRRDA